MTAAFNSPKGVAIRSDGYILVADTSNHAIRTIDPSREVRTLAGDDPGFADGRMDAARFYKPTGVAIDRQGNLYVADSGNNAIRKVTPDGMTVTLAGGTKGERDGAGRQAQFNDPKSVAVDDQGTVYVVDAGNHRLRKITADGTVTTLAGSTLGFEDGPGGEANFARPEGITIDNAGNILVADTLNHRIRKVTPQGHVTTLAGSGLQGMLDGPAAKARFNNPADVDMDVTGIVYVADSENNCVRMIRPDGSVGTLAGQPGTTFTNGTGDLAQFYRPTGLNTDAVGKVYVADTGNDCIRRID
jgi:sugar lactone lactonase YvrE